MCFIHTFMRSLGVQSQLYFHLLILTYTYSPLSFRSTVTLLKDTVSHSVFLLSYFLFLISEITPPPPAQGDHYWGLSSFSFSTSRPLLSC